MTVADLILELQFQNPDLEVYINRFNDNQDIYVDLYSPDMKEPYILIAAKKRQLTCDEYCNGDCGNTCPNLS